MTKLSQPVNVSSTAAYWPESPIICRTFSGCLITSIPPTVALPEFGVSNVARILTVVVLPAPFGPSTLKTVPSSTSRLKPSSAFTLPLL